MKKEELRSLTDEHHYKLSQERADRLTKEKEEMFRNAENRLKEAAEKGFRKAVIYTVSSFREDLIYLSSECEYSYLEDSHETIKLAKQKLAELDIDCLRGTVAELRDHYVSEGLKLFLQMRVEGNRCNSAHYVWDIVATW